MLTVSFHERFSLLSESLSMHEAREEVSLVNKDVVFRHLNVVDTISVDPAKLFSDLLVLKQLI